MPGKETLAVGLAAASLMLCASGTGPVDRTDHMVLGPDQFKYDRSGSGAVLCSWSVLVETQAATKTCGLSHTPSDDAIDRAILDIDDFIVANSSLHPSRAALEEFKHRSSEAFIRDLRDRNDLQKFCTGHDLKIFRGDDPDKVAASVRALIAKPREPVMNPCL